MVLGVGVPLRGVCEKGVVDIDGTEACEEAAEERVGRIGYIVGEEGQDKGCRECSMYAHVASHVVKLRARQRRTWLQRVASLVRVFDSI